MTKPETMQDAPLSDVRKMLQSARPDQILRLLEDILKQEKPNDFNQTGRA